jgi:hypothetical protein
MLLDRLLALPHSSLSLVSYHLFCSRSLEIQVACILTYVCKEPAHKSLVDKRRLHYRANA